MKPGEEDELQLEDLILFAWEEIVRTAMWLEKGGQLSTGRGINVDSRRQKQLNKKQQQERVGPLAGYPVTGKVDMAVPPWRIRGLKSQQSSNTYCEGVRVGRQQRMNAHGRRRNDKNRSVQQEPNCEYRDQGWLARRKWQPRLEYKGR
ncbi:hypothetical protein R1flu_019776 [Riccia fluitans]|uniref:Uncharacterized protein n=1 Tax=Riccia fluitans TaxID=41844 RepID=A0ABD1ZJU8_9MARC